MLWAACLAAVLVPRGAFAAEDPTTVRLYIEADRMERQAEIALVVGNVRFMPPKSDTLIMADAGIIWIKRKEAYLEGNVRVCTTLGKPVPPGTFDVPRPDLNDRTGLEPGESLEKAGDLDDIINPPRKKMAILVDTRVPVSECERLYINWADAEDVKDKGPEEKRHAGTLYMLRPTLRLAEADRIANWVVTAPSAEGIATYKIPIVDKDGKETGKYEKRRHLVMDAATFTACTFKHPHTRFRTSKAEMVEGDFLMMDNVVFHMGHVPILYLPRLYKDLEHDWPWMKFAFGTSSRVGTFASLMLRFRPAKGIKFLPRIEWMSERGVTYGLGAEYRFGHEREIRGALDVFWVPDDQGTDELADTSRPGSGWPAGWPGGLGPLPADIPLGLKNRYRIKFVHQQEAPEGWEFDLEVHKFSDAGVYREYFEEEFKTEKDPETRAMLKYGRNNWAVFIHLKKRINDFLSQTEYLPQIGFNLIAQPIGGGFLFTSDTELARVTTRYGDVRRRLGQTNLAITRIWLRRNEYSRPPALTLRQDDTDGLTGWRFDTLNVLSRPFAWGIFNIEPWIGWRGSWFQHGIESIRGNYAGVLPPIGPALPPAVAAASRRTGDRVRSQVLAGARIATQYHRVYDVSRRPFLRQFFPHGQRHIITPEMTYIYESTPTREPRHLPDNDTVTDQNGLHRINVALRNRWQTRRPPEIERDPRAPLGGEWYRRRRAVELSREAGPINVVDLDLDIDLFLNPRRDNIHLRGKRIRRWSNLRTDLTVRPSSKTSIFLDTEFALEGARFEVISAGVQHQPRPDLSYSLSHDYHFHDASELTYSTNWELNPKWHVQFDVQQDFSGGGSWDREILITRRFHEWQVTLGFEFDKGKRESIASISVGANRSRIHRPSWRYQPKSVAAFQLSETAR